MSGKAPRAGPGPSAAAHKANPERSYTGPKPESLPRPRTPAEAEAFYASLAKSGTGPPLPRFSRMIGVAGWVAGGFAAAYMVLYYDFGNTREHVFSPIRREYHKFTDSLFNLSASERSMIEAASKDAAAAAPGPAAVAVAPAVK
ncbi:uncharacterized protein LOC62_06G008329 [Vanrija pseudolonga]|uniref:Transmembrane protein n=1 Tax=Vanrija pseudolonga TaxID=143232 RepID=A0AAF1BL89_9TREE|nr:hypothetical protein LOC62_06G008329 [Vanrija pseudolonga]